LLRGIDMLYSQTQQGFCNAALSGDSLLCTVLLG